MVKLGSLNHAKEFRTFETMVIVEIVSTVVAHRIVLGGLIFV